MSELTTGRDEWLMTEHLTAIKGRRDEAYRWITTLQMADGRRRGEGLLVSAEKDIDALLTAYERLRNEFVSVCEELEAEQHDNERLRARVAELEAPREGILATAQALRLRVNEAAGKEGD